jgi:hypothetical protein
MDWAFHESQIRFDIRAEREEYEWLFKPRGFCKIGLRGVGAATGPDVPLFLSGKKST